MLGMSLSWRQCPLSQRTSNMNRKLQSARRVHLICRLSVSHGKLPPTAVFLFASSCWIVLFLTNTIQKQPAEFLNWWITTTRWSECENTEGNLKTGKKVLRHQTECHADDGLQKKNLLILPNELAHPIYCNIQVNIPQLSFRTEIRLQSWVTYAHPLNSVIQAVYSLGYKMKHIHDLAYIFHSNLFLPHL